MQSHGETAGSDVMEAGGDTDDSGNNPDENGAVGAHRRRGGLSIFPALLGVFVCALSIWISVRLWSLLFPKPGGNVAIALLVTALFIGVLLIVYAVVLRRLESKDQVDTTTLGQVVERDSGHIFRFVSWIVIPLVLGLSAAGTVVWAANAAQPDAADPVAPKTCFELYQDALNMQKQNPKFRMPARDRDETRCGINKTVLTVK